MGWLLVFIGFENSHLHLKLNIKEDLNQKLTQVFRYDDDMVTYWRQLLRRN